MAAPLILAALAVLLSACGGGGGGSDPSPPARTPLALSGTAAIGTALAGAAVSVKCLGATGQATTGADGGYSLQLLDAQLPCVLRVADGKGQTLHSMAQAQSASVVANITPLTDLLLSRAAKKAASTVFEGFSDELAADLRAASLSTAQGELIGLLNGTVDASGINNFISSPLKASAAGQVPTDPHDLVLDKFSQRVTPTLYQQWTQLLASGGPLPDPIAFVPDVRLDADSITLPVGAAVPLVAHLNYPPNVRYLRPPVSWTLVEPDAGKLSADGGVGTLYTAPNQKGTYHVKAVRDDYVRVSATLTINVVDFVPILEVAQSEVSLMPGQTQQFSAFINYPPGVAYIRPPISWKLVEPEGGSISIDGAYTAPMEPGTYHAQVRRDDFADKTVMVEIKVGAYQSLDRYARSLQYAVFTPERSVIRDAAAWASWQKAHQPGLQPPTEPAVEVDFSKHMVVAIILPPLPQCSSARLLDLKPVAGVLRASIQVLPPAAPDQACAAVVWTPVFVLVTARTELPLEVIEQK